MNPNINAARLRRLFYLRRRPLSTLASVSAMMMASILAAALWIFSYLERFRSPRPFSLEVTNRPSSAPLYVYADTMNDFNYYTEREGMPILASDAVVEALIAKGENGFM
jgi:hypothetical protein